MFAFPIDSCLTKPAPAANSYGDEELVAGLQASSEEAYETLICRFQQPVYNLVCRLLSDPADASDVVQEVFLKVFRKIGNFRADSSLKTWIYRIAVNEANNHRRWFSRHCRNAVGLTREEGERNYSENLQDPGRTPFDLACDHETRALVEAALAHLNPNFRGAVVLRDIEDLSYEEIAQILEVSLGTVKSRILRGREALRKALAERLDAGRALNWFPQPVE